MQVGVEVGEAEKTLEEKACQANSREISAEVDRAMTDPEIVARWQKRVSDHQARYPGGKLPSELRDLDAFKIDGLKMMSMEERLNERCTLACLKCGQIPEHMKCMIGGPAY